MNGHQYEKYENHLGVILPILDPIVSITLLPQQTIPVSGENVSSSVDIIHVVNDNFLRLVYGQMSLTSFLRLVYGQMSLTTGQ